MLPVSIQLRLTLSFYAVMCPVADAESPTVGIWGVSFLFSNPDPFPNLSPSDSASRPSIEPTYDLELNSQLTLFEQPHERTHPCSASMIEVIPGRLLNSIVPKLARPLFACVVGIHPIQLPMVWMQRRYDARASSVRPKRPKTRNASTGDTQKEKYWAATKPDPFAFNSE